MAQWVKNLPERQETWVRFLSWEDPLEKEIATYFSILAWGIPSTEEEMATHSSILAGKIPWTEEPGYRPWGLQLDTTE